MKQLFIIITVSCLSTVSCVDSTKQILCHYERYDREINGLADHVLQLKSDKYDIYIYFHHGNKIDFRLYPSNHMKSENAFFDENGQFIRWKISMYHDELIEAYMIAEMNLKQIKALKKDLNRIRCHSIGTGYHLYDGKTIAYVSIGYPTNGIYALDYLVYESELSSENSRNLLESCRYKKINNRVFIRYTGPVFGSDCFPDKRKI